MMGILASLFGRDAEPEDVVGTLDFPRKIQWDRYSCGAQCVLAIAEFYGIDTDFDAVAAAINLTRDGTAQTPIVRYLRQQGLRVGCHDSMRWGHLERVLTQGGVVLVDLDGDHWGVVHAISDADVWVANPSLRRQLGRRVSRERFQEQWTGLGIAIRPRP